MSERKPAGEAWESFIDRQIRAAQEAGQFDRLPGHGKPIPGLHGTDDEMWWVRQFLQREQISLLPATLEIRLEAEKALAEIAGLADEDAVRRRLDAINAKIRKVNATAIDGPASSLSPLDAEEVLRHWREGRSHDRKGKP